MECRREGALLILGKWRDEGRPLVSSFSFSPFIASLRGKIVSLTEAEFRIISDDRTAELAVSLDRVVAFGYGEPKHGTDEAETFVSALIFFFSEPSPDEEADILTVTEAA